MQLTSVGRDDDTVDDASSTVDRVEGRRSQWRAHLPAAHELEQAIARLPLLHRAAHKLLHGRHKWGGMRHASEHLNDGLVVVLDRQLQCRPPRAVDDRHERGRVLQAMGAITERAHTRSTSAVMDAS